MTEYIVGRVEDVPEGKSVAVQAGQAVIAVFNVGGEIYAMQNRCPHKGASLCDGKVDRENKVVRCPWHTWDFSLETGCLAAYPKRKAATVKVRVQDGEIRLVMGQGSTERSA